MNKILIHLTSLRQGITKNGLAPHNPIQLLAVMDGFEKGTLWGKENDGRVSTRSLSYFRQTDNTDICGFTYF